LKQARIIPDSARGVFGVYRLLRSIDFLRKLYGSGALE
jgi:hypothetical protein